MDRMEWGSLPPTLRSTCGAVCSRTGCASADCFDNSRNFARAAAYSGNRDSHMRFALLAAASLLLAGCHVGFEETGPTEHYVKTIELDKSELARVEVKMGAGELKVEGGSPKLLDADFAYNISSWKPLVRYNASSFRGELLIEQPSGSHTAGNVEYTWNLRFNDKLPVDFVTHLGAGEAHM